MKETIGFIGLGNMGAPMAANLMQAGYRLRVYNRTALKASRLVDQGAKLADGPAEVAQPGGIVCTMLSDDCAVEQVCLAPQSFVEKLGPGGVHVSLSTIAPATARKLAAHHARYGVAYVAAPVFGRPEAAAARLLWVCASGPAEAREKVRPALNAVSQGIFDFGEDCGAANIVKLCGNFLIAAAIEALSESFTLAEKNGIEPRDVADMLGKTLFACPIYQGYGKQIATQAFEPAGFRLALGRKDVDLVLETAAANLVPMPIASLLRDRLLAGLAKGREDLDWTAVALDVAADAGLHRNPAGKA